jgi:hypothetical protein
MLPGSPVFYAKSRHTLEIAQVAREEQRVIRQGDRGNSDIHGANTQFEFAKVRRGQRRRAVESN